MVRCLSYLLACCLLWASLSVVSAAPAVMHGDAPACASTVAGADGKGSVAMLDCHVQHDPANAECADCHHCQHMIPLLDGRQSQPAGVAVATAGLVAACRGLAAGPDGPPPQRPLV